MKQTVYEHDFINAFQSIRPDNFTYAGLKALYAWFEECADLGAESETELDVIAICCEFTEYETMLECAQEYGYEEVVDLEPHGSVDLIEVAELEEAQAFEWLQERTTVIKFKGGVITQDF